MPIFDPDKMADQVITAMRGYVMRGIEKVTQQLTRIEKELREKIDKDGAAQLALVDGLVKAIEVTPGKDGERGADGSHGRDGKDGIDGKDGLPGKDGERGADGKSIDFDSFVAQVKEAVALESSRIAERIKAEVIAALPQPEPGVPGASGKDGIDGRDGRDGKDGRDGNHGKDGAPGRDALEVDILTSLDLSRSYPAGTYAARRGGTVRAFRETDPFLNSDAEASLESLGWRVVTNGIASVSAKQVDPRNAILRQELTDGSIVETPFVLPTTIFKGVWTEGTRYVCNDQVARQGSMWTCIKDTTEMPMSGAIDWVLSTKKGSDGRDGKDGKPGQRGPQGTPGKDGDKY